jgi:hypothetical protein
LLVPVFVSGIVASLSPETLAALIGVGVGWVLGLGSDLVRDWRGALRHRRSAALFVYAELTENLGAVMTLRHFGFWPLERPRRHAWETYGKELLYGGNIERAVWISTAYAMVDDIALAVKNPSADWTEGEGAENLKKWTELIQMGVVEAGQLTGISREEAIRRLEAADRLGPEQKIKLPGLDGETRSW